MKPERIEEGAKKKKSLFSSFLCRMASYRLLLSKVFNRICDLRYCRSTRFDLDKFPNAPDAVIIVRKFRQCLLRRRISASFKGASSSSFEIDLFFDAISPVQIPGGGDIDAVERRRRAMEMRRIL